LKSQDQERRRIARDLHDSVAQQLVGQLLSLKQLQNRMASTDPELKSLVADSLQIGKDCLREVRTISFLLHPPHLQELGLAGAVQYYAQEFGARSGIRVTVRLPQRATHLSADHELALYRVVQEALSNIHRHSGSPTADVRLICGRENVRLEIRDTGKGMPGTSQLDGQPAAFGIGIPGMRERLRSLGGQLEILPAKPGTRVLAILPRARRH
jgi:signal transduction histidine kinase